MLFSIKPTSLTIAHRSCMNNKKRKWKNRRERKNQPTNKTKHFLSQIFSKKYKINNGKHNNKNKYKNVWEKGKNTPKEKRKTFYLGTILFYCSQMK